MTNKNIDLPSQRARIPLEVEKPLSRKFRRQTETPMWLVWILILLTATLLYALVSRIVDDQAAAVHKAKAAEVSTLCSQYLNDSKLSGTAAQETLNQICL